MGTSPWKAPEITIFAQPLPLRRIDPPGASQEGAPILDVVAIIEGHKETSLVAVRLWSLCQRPRCGYRRFSRNGLYSPTDSTIWIEKMVKTKTEDFVICTLIICTIALQGCTKPSSRNNRTKGEVSTESTDGPSLYKIGLDPASQDKAIFTVYSSKDRILMAIFSTGKAYISQNHIEGGLPYQTGTLSNDNLASIYRKLTDATRMTSQAYTLPDGEYLTLVISMHGKCDLRLDSCHEIYEIQDKMVATQEGLIALQGQSEASVKNQRSIAYLKFRDLWNRLRHIIDVSDLDAGEITAHEITLVPCKK